MENLKNFDIVHAFGNMSRGKIKKPEGFLENKLFDEQKGEKYVRHGFDEIGR